MRLVPNDACFPELSRIRLETTEQKRRELVLALSFCITQAGIETGMIRNLVAL
jgi:hypothetical protein